MKKENIIYQHACSQEILNWLPQLAQLRIEIFHEWPYIYKGSLEYEKKYLTRYSQAQKSFIGMAFDQDKLIGATSCIWLPDESDLEIKNAFMKKGYNPNEVVYFGESILKKDYRGLGIGSEFMKIREKFAKEKCHAKLVGFCSVERPSEHPLRPKEYTSLKDFWQHKGFTEQSDMFCKMSWQDLDQDHETEKKLRFWLKNI